MKIIGRKWEKDTLYQCLISNKPEFIAVYGRRRIGKTYLIREFFNRQFSFYATGVSDQKTKGQLRAFHACLNAYNCTEKALPVDWFEAFSRLRALLESDTVYREPIGNKRVVFLDELPWMDTPRSDFRSSLDFFWNSWASAQPDIVLIVCGSATSWIITNLLAGKRGFHNRITRRIHLAPFSLAECEQMYELNDIVLTREQMIESYMTFGGIPQYLNYLDPRLSLSRNINELCFKDHGALRNEYFELFSSLFSNPEKHMSILEALAKNRDGLSRTALSQEKNIGGGSVLTKDLRELEECGFIRKFTDYAAKDSDSVYQITDPFTLFSLRFISKKSVDSWNSFINTPGYYSWRGLAFETVCLNHISQIRNALGISGIETGEYSWHSGETGSEAQIDLIIKRADGVINLCEMKYTNEPYILDATESEKIQRRMARFQKTASVKEAIHITLICGNGYKRSRYSGIIQNLIVGDDLFVP